MKNNLRIMAAAVVLSFGMGTANATLIQPVFFPSWNAISGYDNITTSTFSNVFNVTLPSDVVSGGANMAGSFNLLGFNFLGFNAFIDSFSLFDVTNSTTIASGVPGSSSVFPFGSLSVSDSYQLLVGGHLIGSNSSGSYSGNLQVSPIPEPEEYTVFLIGMGLIGFSLRCRKTRVSVASFA